MALIKNWGYGETEWLSSGGRRQVRFVGRCNQSAFIRTILGGRRGSQWIKDRMCNTGNDYELSLIAKHPNSIVKYDERTHKVLDVMKLG